MESLGSVAEASSYFFMENVNPSVEEILDRVREPEAAVNALNHTLDVLYKTGELAHDTLEEELRKAAAEMGLSASRYFGHAAAWCSRGRKASPPLFETMEALGKERCVRRIDAALDTLSK